MLRLPVLGVSKQAPAVETLIRSTATEPAAAVALVERKRPRSQSGGTVPPSGVSQPGGSSYRDVPPGHYHLSVDSYGVDFGQTRDVDLAPGAQIFAKVVSNDNWIEGGGGGRGGGGYHRNTFYVWLYPFEAAWPVIAQSWFYGGGPLYASLTSH